MPPPVRGGCTSCQSSEIELRRCHRLTRAVAPPSQSSETELKRLHLCQRRLHHPARARRLSLWVVPPPIRGGCTSCKISETELRRCHRQTRAVAPPSQSSETEPWALPPPTQAVPPLAKKSGSEWADPFCLIWVRQGPNCPKIKLMGSPPIST